MYEISEAAVQVVAQGTRDTIEQYDAGFETGLRTLADALAGLRGSGVPAGRIQHVQDSMVDSFDGYRKMRRSFIQGIGHLQAIQRRSTQAETAAGCPTPWQDFFTTAALQEDDASLTDASLHERA